MSVIQVGNRFSLKDFNAAYDVVPKGVYILKWDPREFEFILMKKDDKFQLPSKIYGDHSIIKRWKKSFENNSEKNMGIILSGLKGTGKTITAQMFCNEMDKPVILITEPFEGPEFVDFMTSHKLGTSIVFIDEFEKVYDNRERERQTDLLSLMDGQYQTKLIFLFTVNNFDINEYLINRLGRLKYKKDYTDLDDEIIEQVIDDLLINKEHKQSIFDFFQTINMCTFDLLVNIIKEVNLFDESATECGKHLNLRAESQFYDVSEIYDGKEYPCQSQWFNKNHEYIEIERISTKYVKVEPKKTIPTPPSPQPLTKEEEILFRNRDVLKFSEEGDDDYIPTYFEWDLSECTMEKIGAKNFILTHNESGIKFKFKYKNNRTILF